MSPAESLPNWPELLLVLPSVIIGFFVFGRLTFLALPSPLPWVSAFLGSFLMLFGCVLALDLVGMPITLLSLGGALALLALGGWLLAKKPAFRLPSVSFRPSWPASLLVIPCALMVVSMLTHAWFNPLAGWDNMFRWNYLALLIRENGSLAHYPPVSSADFRIYPWSDGIPPGVPLLNLWLYLSTGSSAGAIVIGRIATEITLIIALTWRLAKNLHGEPGAWLALCALSTSALFAWSIGLAQETGTTAVFLLLLVNLLHAYRHSPARSTAIWIGLAASGAALCREYNLVFPPLALGLLMHARAPRRDLLATAFTALLVTLPWYARNSWKTENPLFPHDFGGLLATNPFHADIMVRVSAFWSPLHHLGAIPNLLAALTVGSGLLAFWALTGFRFREKRLLDTSVVLLAIVALWLLSLPKTGGGWNYSLRVLGSAAPLLAIFASAWGPRLSTRAFLWLGVLAIPFAADAARRSWIFINAPMESPWPFTWKTYRTYQPTVAAVQDPESFSALIAVAEGEGIVLDQPNYVVGVRNRGGAAISIFSPEVTSLTQSDASTPIAHTIAELRAKKIRFVVLTQQDDFNTFCALTHASMRRIWLLPPTLDLDAVRLYDLAVMNGESPAKTLLTPAQ